MTAAAVADPGQAPFFPPPGARRSPGVAGRVRHELVISAARLPRADPVSVLVSAFSATAAAYALAAATLLAMALGEHAPATIQGGDALAHVLLATAGAVLAGLGVVAYDLPRHADRRLKSVLLGWAHLALLNGAFMGAALAYHAPSLRLSVSWGALLVGTTLAQVAGLAAMGWNVIATFLEPPAPAPPPPRPGDAGPEEPRSR